MISARAREIYEKAAMERMKAGGGDRKSGSAALHHPNANQGRSADQVAATVGVGGRSVAKAVKILKRGAPETATCPSPASLQCRIHAFRPQFPLHLSL
jgi:hypothetical protein